MPHGLRLIVMRHAKSVPGSLELPDHSRPLAPRGRRDAPVMGRWLVTEGWAPDRVLCSDSTRTRETWMRMAEAFEPLPDVRFVRRLYQSSVADFEQVVLSTHGECATLMTVAHNPGCEDLVKHLSDETVALTTGNAVLLASESDRWLDAMQPGRFSLVDVLRPRPPTLHGPGKR